MAETKELKEFAEKAGDLAKNIWLAGLGAYGKALDEAQDQYDKVSGKVNEQVEKVKSTADSNLFEDLIEKGKQLEGETQEKLQDAKDKASTNLEERLEQVKSSLSFNKSSSDIEDKLEQLASKLDMIIEALGASAAPAKKTTTRKVAAKSTTKAAEEKSAS
ncbi:Uncharacterised protein [BD1-7 clade bacterium]|uniref:Phasin family protein n=1 Tax=BD1-7 clade bacterium TaxID=2029982 RepID=A0A5S9QMR6_9GAMM|nr:Uncharacterised protein [BD1-7 clade bacterium]CAA0120748.1 Uncharacterised protein [BD1-7 clade bacterium]